MSTAPGATAGLVDHFFRHESGRLVATLVRRFTTSRLELIEDAVQSALAAALSTWTRTGIPDNPSAWLTSAARNHVLDHLRREQTAARGSQDVGLDAKEGADTKHSPMGSFDEIDDDELRMLFVCCDDDLSNQGRLVLALKLLCGFNIREISARLFISEANAHKLLSRGRSRLREIWDNRPDWSTPERAQVQARLPTVQGVIYLLFNEGYSSLSEEEPIRRDLCEEALRLGRLLAGHEPTATPETWALLALLEFHSARLDARMNGQGALLLLEEQDRSLWNRESIARGFACLMHAGKGENFSRYHAEAAVLAEHCFAPSFEQTRWSEIVGLYEMLEARQPSPIHTLNRAIALAQWKGPAEGLALLQESAPPTWLVGHYLWDATNGEFLRRLGRFTEAEKALRQASANAPTSAQRDILARKLARCLGEDDGG